MAIDDKKTLTTGVLAIGITSIVLGIIVGVITFVTLIGPIIGVLLVIFGIGFLWASAKKARRPATTEPRDPDAEKRF